MEEDTQVVVDDFDPKFVRMRSRWCAHRDIDPLAIQDRMEHVERSLAPAPPPRLYAMVPSGGLRLGNEPVSTAPTRPVESVRRTPPTAGSTGSTDSTGSTGSTGLMGHTRSTRGHNGQDGHPTPYLAHPVHAPTTPRPRSAILTAEAAQAGAQSPSPPSESKNLTVQDVHLLTSHRGQRWLSQHQRQQLGSPPRPLSPVPVPVPSKPRLQQTSHHAPPLLPFAAADWVNLGVNLTPQQRMQLLAAQQQQQQQALPAEKPPSSAQPTSHHPQTPSQPQVPQQQEWQLSQQPMPATAPVQTLPPPPPQVQQEHSPPLNLTPQSSAQPPSQPEPLPSPQQTSAQATSSAASTLGTTHQPGNSKKQPKTGGTTKRKYSKKARWGSLRKANARADAARSAPSKASPPNPDALRPGSATAHLYAEQMQHLQWAVMGSGSGSGNSVGQTSATGGAMGQSASSPSSPHPAYSNQGAMNPVVTDQHLNQRLVHQQQMLQARQAQAQAQVQGQGQARTQPTDTAFSTHAIANTPVPAATQTHPRPPMTTAQLQALLNPQA